MSWTSERWREMRGNAWWDGLKFLVGGAIALARPIWALLSRQEVHSFNVALTVVGIVLAAVGIILLITAIKRSSGHAGAVERRSSGDQSAHQREARATPSLRRRQRVLRKAVEQIAKHRAANPQFVNAYLLPAVFAAGADELENSEDLDWVCNEIAKQHRHPFWAFNASPIRLAPEDRLEFLRQMRISGRNIQTTVNAYDFYTKDWETKEAQRSTPAALLQPGDIIDEISRRPPFQRAEAIRHYKGISVDWELCLISAPPGTKPTVNALFRQPAGQGRSAFVQCTVDADANPDVKIAHETDVLRVRGTVEGLSGVDVITLTEVSVCRTGRRTPQPH